MKKIYLGILVTLSVVGVWAAVAQALTFIPASVAPSGVTVSVPDVAVDKPPVLSSLESGSLERVVFIHYANGKTEARARAKAPSCYKLLGVKWRALPVNYVVDPAVDAIVPGAIPTSLQTWDDATSKALFGSHTVDSASWDGNSPDGKNEYSLENYPQDGVIAVTVIWSGIKIGEKGRQIIEYDVMFDTDFSPWGNALVDGTSTMDLQNIAVHETGHGLGLGDIYESTCGEVTMYGYSGYGETKKRDLAAPDILGLQKMYGI